MATKPNLIIKPINPYQCTIKGKTCFYWKYNNPTTTQATIAEYLYDRAGNLVSDPDGASIAWTAYGKVRDVTVGSNVTKFRYDAAGHSRAGHSYQRCAIGAHQLYSYWEGW